MTNRVNPAMNAVQAAGGDPAMGSRFRDARIADLLHRDDTVLTPGEPGNEDVRVRFGASVPHVRN